MNRAEEEKKLQISSLSGLAVRGWKGEAEQVEKKEKCMVRGVGEPGRVHSMTLSEDRVGDGIGEYMLSTTLETDSGI